LKPKNAEISAVDSSPEVIRVKTPSAASSSNPSPIVGLTLAASFETVMYSFTAVNDIDLDYFEYELYDNAGGTGSPIKTGRAKANVFTVAVTNSTDSTPTTYSGRVRTVSTSGAKSDYSGIAASGNTPLIESQYINNLTANKITAGTIGAHTISLAGSTSVIKSSTYDGQLVAGSWTTGNTGWLIAGNGQAIFDATQIRGSISAGSINLNTHNFWLPSTVGPPSTPVTFKVGTGSQYLLFDGTNLSLSGSLSSASGTFTGSLSSASGTFTGALDGGTIKIGSGASVFKADSNGIYLGSETFGIAPFRVSTNGIITATAGSIGSYSIASGSLTSSSSGMAGINNTWSSNIALNTSSKIITNTYYVDNFNSYRIS